MIALYEMKNEINIKMNKNQVAKVSKFLSYVLRHKPQVIGLDLDAQGWADTKELLDKCNAAGKKIDLPLLEYVVENNNKKRFAFNEDNSRIRANQGHSIKLDLGLEAVEPPAFLYHGTATRFINAIRKTGLLKMNRHHVHLSKDLDTATNVGGRHGVPVILQVKALEMHKAGMPFYVSDNGVWLTDHVPLDYILFP